MNLSLCTCRLWGWYTIMQIQSLISSLVTVLKVNPNLIWAERASARPLSWCGLTRASPVSVMGRSASQPSSSPSGTGAPDVLGTAGHVSKRKALQGTPSCPTRRSRAHRRRRGGHRDRRRQAPARGEFVGTMGVARSSSPASRTCSSSTQSGSSTSRSPTRRGSGLPERSRPRRSRHLDDLRVDDVADAPRGCVELWLGWHHPDETERSRPSCRRYRRWCEAAPRA